MKKDEILEAFKQLADGKRWTEALDRLADELAEKEPEPEAPKVEAKPKKAK